MNPYRNTSNADMYKQPRNAAVLREIRRRVLIADFRWKAREVSGAKLPSIESIRNNRFKTIYTRYDIDGQLLHEIALNCDIARLALNDWHRVRIRWQGEKGIQAWGYLSYGVSVMHAVLVAQMAGMPIVAYPTFSAPSTRREKGEIRLIQNRATRQCRVKR